jgi:hypothetical protein
LEIDEKGSVNTPPYSLLKSTSKNESALVLMCPLALHSIANTLDINRYKLYCTPKRVPMSTFRFMSLCHHYSARAGASDSGTHLY